MKERNIDYNMRNYGTDEERLIFQMEWTKTIHKVRKAGIDLSEIRIVPKRNHK